MYVKQLALSAISPSVEGQDLRRAQDEEYQLSLLEEDAKREAEEQATLHLRIHTYIYTYTHISCNISSC
jgi:hypothetical protein